MVIIELEPHHLDMMVEITQFEAEQNYLPSACFDTRENLGGCSKFEVFFTKYFEVSTFNTLDSQSYLPGQKCPQLKYLNISTSNRFLKITSNKTQVFCLINIMVFPKYIQKYKPLKTSAC